MRSFKAISCDGNSTPGSAAESTSSKVEAQWQQVVRIMPTDEHIEKQSTTEMLTATASPGNKHHKQ